MIPKTTIDRLLYFFDDIFPGIRDRFVIREDIYNTSKNACMFEIHARTSASEWNEVVHANIRIELLANRLLEGMRLRTAYLSYMEDSHNMNYTWLGYLVRNQ